MKSVEKIKIVPSTAELCGRLLAHIPEEDNLDMIRGWGMTSEEAVMMSYAVYTPSYIVLHGDEPMMIFGCDTDGGMWMMRGNHMDDISIRFIRKSKEYFDKWLKDFGHISCQFWGENKKLKRFLEWSGFESTDLGNGYVRCDKWA